MRNPIRWIVCAVLIFFITASGPAAGDKTPAEAPLSEEEENQPAEGTVFLPKDFLFSALIADPRWPHFSASFQHYTDKNRQIENVGAVNFGETFTICRFDGFWRSRMEIGIQAGVFAIFDLDAPSSDLINADYYVGIPVVFAKGNFSNMTRISHQSSHLGDEFVLRDRVDDRINLSFEQVDSLFSYRLPKGFRIYGGGGYLFNKTPSDLDSWSTQAGLEFRSPVRYLEEVLRPVAAVDIQNRQESGWDTDLSIRCGVQLSNPNLATRKLAVLVEYYSGHSPNGQFFDQTIEYIGIGIHLFF